MKKISRFLFIFSLVLLISLAASGTVFAGKGGNPKGTITGIDETAQTLTLETETGTLTVHLPEGFDYTSIAVDMFVVVRGDWDGDTEFYAQTVKETTPEAEAEGGDDDDDDGGPSNGEDKGNHQNVYCTGRKDHAHPMATGIAETYGVSEGEVMNMFCNNFSIGEIMLALQTQQMNGTPPEDSLAQRQNGMGWGQIWKEAGLIGNPDHGTPPGHGNKPDNPGHGGSPPGQGKGKP